MRVYMTPPQEPLGLLTTALRADYYYQGQGIIGPCYGIMETLAKKENEFLAFSKKAKMKLFLCSVLTVMLLFPLIFVGCGVQSSEQPPQSTVAAPTFSPASGTYSSALEVIISTSTSGASIRYTTDSSTPTSSNGNEYTTPIHISSTTTLKAVAYKTGWTTSTITAGNFAIEPLVAAPQFSPAPGTYASAQDVIITSATSGVTIRYTTDGSTPTSASGLIYSSPVHLSETRTLKAMAYMTGWTTSTVISGLYTIEMPVSATEFNPASGFFTEAQNITITTTTAGASIRYTTDGSIPSSTNGTLYSSAVPITETTTLRAIAYKTGLTSSPVTIGEYKRISISAGYRHTIMAKSDGTVWAWGNNMFGQLGNGSTISSLIPVQVPGLSGIVSVSAGDNYSIALKRDGTVWTWGGNMNGELGDGTTTTRLTPAQVPGISNVTAILGSLRSTYVVKSDGTIWAWGTGTSWQLGDGDGVDRSSPVQAICGSDLVDIGAGGSHAVALRSNGALVSWGTNSRKELGNASNGTVPMLSAFSSGVNDITAGPYFSVALKTDGTVWGWGTNYYGQLGDGYSGVSSSPVVQALGLSTIIAIQAGGGHTIALNYDGTLWAWGRNENGQLGDGTNTNRSIPVPVLGISGAVAIGTHYHTVVVLGDGSVWAWGWNSEGQLGDGTTTDRWIPCLIIGN
jgi:alpha-tubulin suppressor-like RCC1 family protein